MNSCRLKYATEISEDIQKLAGVGRTSAIALKANQILLPIGGKQGDKLLTIEETYEWGKVLKKQIDEKYQAKSFGSLVHLDTTANRGTVMNITITSRILDAYEAKNGDKPLAQLNTVDKKNELINKLDTNLLDYAKANGIKVEFLDSLKEEYPNDPIAIYDNINKVIKINKGEARKDTLPEELAHHLTQALGNDHLLITRAMNLIGRLDYKGILGQEYVDLYNNDANLLKHEFLGKLIANHIANPTIPATLESENGIKLWETIKRLIDSFIALFKSSSNIESEMEKIVAELANMITTGVKVGTETEYNPYKMFQTNPKKEISKDYKDQYVYYRHNLKELKKLNRKLEAEITDSNRESNLAKIAKNTERINKIDSSLKELLESNNKQLIINLATDTLNDIESYIQRLELVKKSGNTPNYEHIEKTVKTLRILESLNGVKDRVASLQKDLKPYVKEFVIQHVNKFTENKLSDLDLKTPEKDIFVGEKGFGTLADVNNHLARTIGFTIKEAQAAIERDNKKSYNELDVQLKALQKYNDSKGISKKDSFKIFIQEYNGTTVLTKPYTTEFYKEIKKSYEMEDDKGLAYRKTLGYYDFENKEWVPTDSKYRNKNYEKIQSTPELKKFYNYFKSTIKELTQDLPINLSENFIPNIIENGLMDILKSDSSLMSKLKEGVMNIMDIYDIEDDNSGFIRDEHLSGDIIPLSYVGKIAPDKKSSDLGTALLKFMYFSNSYKHMSEVLPKTRLLQEMIKEQSFVKNTNTSVGIKGENTNLYKMTEAFINMQVKGEMKNDEAYAPYIDFGLKYTSLLRIGLNPFNALTNIFIGNIGNIVEAVGGRNFTYKEYNQARKVFFEQVFTENSKLNKLIETFNPLMELDDYENLNKVNIGSSEYKDKIKSLMYAPQRIGEKYLQTSTMIASLLHDKVTTKDGKSISKWEAFKEDGSWNTELMGYELTDDMIFKTTNKVQRINQMIHGRYSQKDAAAFSQNALFRAAFQFKKWIPSAIEMRLGEKRFDERLGHEVEGRYFAYLKGWNLMVAKLKGDIEKIEANKFTETDIYNMRKNVTELTIMLSSILMYVGLGAAGDDDKKLKKNGLYKFTMSQLDRVSGDLLFWYSPDKLNESAMQVVPLLKTHKDLLKVVYNVPYIFGIEGSEYTKGRKKGENKFISSVIDVTPVVKPLVDIKRTFNKEPYQEPKSN
jgi:hypothetical protein